MQRRILNLGLVWIGCFSLQGQSLVAEEKPDLIKASGLAQAWIFNDTTVTAAKPNFRIRRAEIKFTATPVDVAKAFVMIDAAKAFGTTTNTVVTATTPATTTTTVTGVNSTADNKILQDVGVTFMPLPEWEFTLGQVKTPTTAEGLDSAAELLLPERSIVGRTFGDKREPGGLVTYKNYGVKATMMFSNGQSTNVDDTSNKKDLTFRVDYEVLPELKVGGFTQAADFSYGSRARHGLNARYVTENYLIRVEGAYQSTNNDAVKSNGLVGEVGYTWEKWQPVFRYEYINPNTALNQTGQGVSVGLNYYVAKHRAKIQMAATYLKDMSGANGQATISTATNGMNGTLLFLAFSSAL